MSTPFIGEIKIVSFTFAPKGWALCNGQLLPINQNQALFSILGTTYGGNGITTFALPNLQGMLPVHTGSGFTLGQAGGEAAHTLTGNELAAHSHTAVGSSNPGSTTDPTNAFWAVAASGAYSTAINSFLAAEAIAASGGSQPHNNMSPYLALNFCIALQGLFPTFA